MLKNFSLRSKINSGFFIIMFLSGMMALVGFLQLTFIESLVEDVIPRSEQSNRLQELAILLESVESEVEEFLLVPDEIRKENIDQTLDKLTQLSFDLKTSPTKTDVIDKLGVSISTLKEDIAPLATLGKVGFVAGINNQILLVYNDISQSRELFQEILTENNRLLRANILTQKESIRVVLVRFVLFEFFIVLGGFIIALLLSQSIIGPVKKLGDAMRIVGQGDYTAAIDTRGKDEIGQLAQAFKNMTDQLRASHESLRVRNQELNDLTTSLEKRVEERTIELEFAKSGLEEEVKKRTEELSQKLEELEKFQRVAVGRELKMVELKKQISSLGGFPPKDG